jgi:hypothetical protein
MLVTNALGLPDVTDVKLLTTYVEIRAPHARIAKEVQR